MKQPPRSDHLVALRRHLAGFYERLDALREQVELQADINLALTVSRGPGLRHELGLALRSTATYTLISGEQVKFVEASGVEFPQHVALGEMPFTYPAPGIGGIARLDEEWGTTIGEADALVAAFDRACACIQALEAHLIDIRKVCPRAKTDRCSLLEVSVEGFWAYFLRFAHEGSSELRHYNSVSDRGAGRPAWIIRGR